MKLLLSTAVTLALLTAAAPAEAEPVEDSVLGCWVHYHTTEVRTPQEQAAHLAGETVDCAVDLAECLVLHYETREYRTPQEEAAHYAGHGHACGRDALGA